MNTIARIERIKNLVKAQELLRQVQQEIAYATEQSPMEQGLKEDLKESFKWAESQVAVLEKIIMGTIAKLSS